MQIANKNEIQLRFCKNFLMHNKIYDRTKNISKNIFENSRNLIQLK